VAKQVTQRELRNNSGDIMRQLDHSESFVVTRNGIPLGELCPLRRRRFIAAEAAVAAFGGAPRVDFVRFRRDLDRVASQEIAPRG
jgi:antitoxin (DNA-binding transcriptional repressor) of toxin-antitoxin stability system